MLFLSPSPFSPDFRLTLIHTFTVRTVNTFSCRHTHTHMFALFSFCIYFVILISHVCTQKRLEFAGGRKRQGEQGNSKGECVRFQNSPSLFGLVLDLQLNTSSNFHLYYLALWQGDLPVLLTITARDKFTCNGQSRIKQVGEMLKRTDISLDEMCLLVKEMYETTDWWAIACALHEHMLPTRITRAERIFSGMCACTEQTAISKTDSPPALQSMHLQRHVRRMRMHTCYISRKRDPVCRNMDTQFECIHMFSFDKE